MIIYSPSENDGRAVAQLPLKNPHFVAKDRLFKALLTIGYVVETRNMLMKV
jgi:hypothetical protein